MDNKDLNSLLGGGESTEPVQDELAVLKQRADLMGIKYSNNIGVEALKKRIEDQQEGREPEPEQNPAPLVQPTPAVQVTAPVQTQSTEPTTTTTPELTDRQKAILEAKRLVRVQIVCHNPSKQSLQGEVFCVANGVIGEVKRFVPFGEFTENGWHIEKCILDMLRERKYLNIRIIKGRNGQRDEQRNEWVREFSITELPPLTREELQELARQQEATGRVNN